MARLYENWTLYGNTHPTDLGYLPILIDGKHDQRPFREQIAANYTHGGGYQPYGEGQWELLPGNVLKFPGDPPLKPMASTVNPFSNEVFLFYPHAVCCIIQRDYTFAVVRMD